jgi:hypothetical protein
MGTHNAARAARQFCTGDFGTCMQSAFMRAELELLVGVVSVDRSIVCTFVQAEHAALGAPVLLGLVLLIVLDVVSTRTARVEIGM